MNRPAVLSTVLVTAVSVFALATPGVASAQAEPTGRDFGQHVADCARTTDMDGSHNPGMHQGFANWDGSPC